MIDLKGSHPSAKRHMAQIASQKISVHLSVRVNSRTKVLNIEQVVLHDIYLFCFRRCLSLRSPSNCDDGSDCSRDLRKRNRSVNDYNLPHEENIKTIDPLMDRVDLVGDFSRQLSLPVTTCGRHSDLKYISTQTMVDLLQGKIPVGKLKAQSLLKSVKLNDWRNN